MIYSRVQIEKEKSERAAQARYLVLTVQREAAFQALPHLKDDPSITEVEIFHEGKGGMGRYVYTSRKNFLESAPGARVSPRGVMINCVGSPLRRFKRKEEE